MQVTTSTSQDVLIIMYEGDLDTRTATQAEIETNKFLKGYLKVVMNLQNTNFVSSAGLRVFLSTAKRLHALDGTLRICNANEIVSEILDKSGFSTIIDVRNDLLEALSDI